MSRFLAVIALASVTACGPRCLRGHDTKVWVSQRCEPVTHYMDWGYGAVPHHVEEKCTAAHWETRFICDQS